MLSATIPLSKFTLKCVASMMEQEKQKLIAIVVAAGVGSRMKSASPKQYLMIEGKTMLEHSVEAMLSDSRIQKLIVVISPADLLGQQMKFEDRRVEVARVGGATRALSVKNGIAYSGADFYDWVLIHDAARPCLQPEHLSHLIDTCLEHNKGGILAVPVNDTLKLANCDLEIKKTVSRENLWRAQTPQMFRVGELSSALEMAGSAVTDEASALEFIGTHPLLIEGSATNLKVTRPEDLWLAQALLSRKNRKENS